MASLVPQAYCRVVLFLGWVGRSGILGERSLTPNFKSPKVTGLLILCPAQTTINLSLISMQHSVNNSLSK